MAYIYVLRFENSMYCNKFLGMWLMQSECCDECEISIGKYKHIVVDFKIVWNLENFVCKLDIYITQCWTKK